MSTPQATFNLPGSDQEPLAPSGTKVFDNGEQIDLHMSTLAELTRRATDLAAPMHQVSEADTHDIDKRRVEFGLNVVTALAQDGAMREEVLQSEPVDTNIDTLAITDPIALTKIGQALVFLRLAQARLSGDQLER